MKLEADNETLAQNKILILYLLSIIARSISNDELYRLVLSIQDINYFYFQQFLLDLEDNRYIINYKKEEDIVYEITQEGKDTLELTIDVLPGIIKQKVDETVKDELREIRNESALRAEFIPHSEREFEVKCKIIDNNNVIFEIKVLATSRDQAINIVQNWRKNAEKIYPSVIHMLNKDIEEGEK